MFDKMSYYTILTIILTAFYMLYTGSTLLSKHKKTIDAHVWIGLGFIWTVFYDFFKRLTIRCKAPYKLYIIIIIISVSCQDEIYKIFHDMILNGFSSQ